MILKKIKQLKDLRTKNVKKTIGLCHGVFDILHKGHIDHLNEARKKCDILVVTVTDDSFVKKGPYQPYNSSHKRAEVINALKSVNYVYVNKDLTSINLINALKPNFYFKGQDYYISHDLTGNIRKESVAVKKNSGNIIFTKTRIMSSTKILNNNLIAWSSDQKNILIKIKKINFNYIIEQIDKLKNIRLNIVGEPILDNYVYTKIVGLASKDPALSGVVVNKDLIPGGVLPAAQIASLFVDNIKLFTYGNNKYLKKILNRNIDLINLSSNQDIQKKTRYINNYRHQKIFQLTNFDKNFFTNRDQKKIGEKLKKAFIDNTLICDFGVGLFEKNIINLINNSKNPKYLNVQSNSINFGFNLFTKYKKQNSLRYISLDEKEWKLGTKDFSIDYNNLKLFLSPETSISITLGRGGSIYYNENKKFYSPVFIDKVIDTTGCGDAYFVITSLLKIVKTDPILIPFLGNIYAGMHALNLANKNVPKKFEYLKYLKSLLNF